MIKNFKLKDGDNLIDVGIDITYDLRSCPYCHHWVRSNSVKGLIDHVLECPESPNIKSCANCRHSDESDIQQSDNGYSRYPDRCNRTGQRRVTPKAYICERWTSRTKHNYDI